MGYQPTDVANQALDAIGSETVLGDIEDGTKDAAVCLRAYRECLRQLLRGAHWSFARKQVPMLLLGDSTGGTVGVGTSVIAPWIYEYAYPADCLAARFVPFQPAIYSAPSGNIAIGGAPISPALSSQAQGFPRLKPTRFLIARDVNYPPDATQIWSPIQGLSPQGRTVVLSNMPNAALVYTSMVIYPNEWDALFYGAMVAYLAQAIALPLSKDKKFGMQVRNAQIQIVKMMVEQARLADGNEAWSTTDHVPDWLAVRRGGGEFGRGSEGGVGYESLPWSPVTFATGSAY